MVEDLLALKKKMDSIVAISFDRNYNFAHAVKESFEVFINQRQNKPAELIGKKSHCFFFTIYLYA